MKNLVVVGIMVVSLTGCMTVHVGNQPAADATVYFGDHYQGQGIYILNMEEPENNTAPHIVLTNLTNSVELTVVVANGYGSEILLRKQDQEVLGLDGIALYDRHGNGPGYCGGQGQTFDLVGAHHTYERLRPGYAPEAKSNATFFCCCTLATYSRSYALRFSDERTNEDEDVVVLPEWPYRLDMTVSLRLEYLVVGQPKWHEKDVQLRIRAFRPDVPNRVYVVVYKPEEKEGVGGGIVVNGKRSSLVALESLLQLQVAEARPLVVRIRHTSTAPQDMVTRVEALCDKMKVTRTTKGL